MVYCISIFGWLLVKIMISHGIEFYWSHRGSRRNQIFSESYSCLFSFLLTIIELFSTMARAGVEMRTLTRFEDRKARIYSQMTREKSNDLQKLKSKKSSSPTMHRCWRLWQSIQSNDLSRWKGVIWSCCKNPASVAVGRSLRSEIRGAYLLDAWSYQHSSV